MSCALPVNCNVYKNAASLIFYFRERELVIRWDYVYEMFINHPELLQYSSLSAVNMTDKQDPSLVGDITCLYEHFLKQGYSAMGMYLKCIKFLCESFLDKNCSPDERVYRAYYCKTFLVEWRNNITGASQFISEQCFKDVCCCVDGLILYMLLLKKEFPNAAVVSFHLGSDPNEQAFSYCRIGQYAGRRTNLDAISIATGLERINVKSTLSGTDDTTAIAHTRGRHVLKMVVPLPGKKHVPLPTLPTRNKIWLGNEINESSIKCSLKTAINDCISDCKKLQFPFFLDCRSNKMPRKLSKTVALSNNDMDENSSEDENEPEYVDEEFVDDEHDEEDYISTSYGKLHIRSAECLFLNGGRLTMGAKSRKSRFYYNSYLESSPLQTFRKSKTCCSKTLQIGNLVTLKSFKDPSRSIKGKIRFMSSAFTPLKNVCKKHSTQKSFAIWLWNESLKLYERCTY